MVKRIVVVSGFDHSHVKSDTAKAVRRLLGNPPSSEAQRRVPRLTKNSDIVRAVKELSGRKES